MKGFQIEDGSSAAVVETDWELECMKVEGLDTEPEPEAMGKFSWSESVQWWTAAGRMEDREIKGLKKDWKILIQIRSYR